MPLLLRWARTFGPGVTATLYSNAPLSRCLWGVQDVRKAVSMRASVGVSRRVSKQAGRQAMAEPHLCALAPILQAGSEADLARISGLAKVSVEDDAVTDTERHLRARTAQGQ